MGDEEKKPAEPEIKEVFMDGHYEPYYDLLTLNIHGGVFNTLAGKTIKIVEITGPNTFGKPRTDGNPHRLEPTVVNMKGLRVKYQVIEAE